MKSNSRVNGITRFCGQLDTKILSGFTSLTFASERHKSDNSANVFQGANYRLRIAIESINVRRNLESDLQILILRSYIVCKTR